MSINAVMHTLKEAHLWDEFIQFLDEQRCGVLVDLMNKTNRTEVDIQKANAQIEVYETLATLDKIKVSNKEREGGLGKLLGSLIHRRM
jgi:hypothetical protein